MLVAIRAKDDLCNCSTLCKTILHHQRTLANWSEKWREYWTSRRIIYFPL